jgi:formamidopyrimidine-DNA glycosylase
LRGATFVKVSRRGKYLLFELSAAKRGVRIKLTGHLGMTGRMYLLPAAAPLPKHAAVVLNLGREKFVFEDTRYFGRFTLGADTIANLGPEPLGKEFTVDYLIAALKRSVQAIKVRISVWWRGSEIFTRVRRCSGRRFPRDWPRDV